VDDFRGVSGDGKVSAGKFGGSPEVSFNDKRHPNGTITGKAAIFTSLKQKAAVAG
jgi:hypothetical protein